MSVKKQNNYVIVDGGIIAEMSWGKTFISNRWVENITKLKDENEKESNQKEKNEEGHDRI